MRGFQDHQEDGAITEKPLVLVNAGQFLPWNDEETLVGRGALGLAELHPLVGHPWIPTLGREQHIESGGSCGGTPLRTGT